MNRSEMAELENSSRTELTDDGTPSAGVRRLHDCVDSTHDMTFRTPIPDGSEKAMARTLKALRSNPLGPFRVLTMQVQIESFNRC